MFVEFGIQRIEWWQKTFPKTKRLPSLLGLAAILQPALWLFLCALHTSARCKVAVKTRKNESELRRRGDRRGCRHEYRVFSPLCQMEVCLTTRSSLPYSRVRNSLIKLACGVQRSRNLQIIVDQPLFAPLLRAHTQTFLHLEHQNETLRFTRWCLPGKKRRLRPHHTSHPSALGGAAPALPVAAPKKSRLAPHAFHQ